MGTQSQKIKLLSTPCVNLIQLETKHIKMLVHKQKLSKAPRVKIFLRNPLFDIFTLRRHKTTILNFLGLESFTGLF